MKNEGFKNSCYQDRLGFFTIGYGHLIKKNEKNFLKKKYSRNYLVNIFEKDFNKAVNQYKKNYQNIKYDQKSKQVLIEMIFQLGIQKQKKFIKMMKYLKTKKLFMAAFEMKNSLWYKQTPKRVDLLINMLLKKKYEKTR